MFCVAVQKALVASLSKDTTVFQVQVGRKSLYQRSRKIHKIKQNYFP